MGEVDVSHEKYENVHADFGMMTKEPVSTDICFKSSPDEKTKRIKHNGNRFVMSVHGRRKINFLIKYNSDGIREVYWSETEMKERQR